MIILEVECPGCGLRLPGKNLAPHELYNASGECWAMKGELSAYNWTSEDLTFMHQYCVDAYGAQHTGPKTKAITTVFALAGLYLAVELHFTGKQVQRAHMNITKPPTGWPGFNTQQKFDQITVMDVLNCKPGESRGEMIKVWAKYIWNSWSAHHDRIKEFCHQYLEMNVCDHNSI